MRLFWVSLGTVLAVFLSSVSFAHAQKEGPFFARACGVTLNLVTADDLSDDIRFGRPGMALPERSGEIVIAEHGGDIRIATVLTPYKGPVTVPTFQYKKRSTFGGYNGIKFDPSDDVDASDKRLKTIDTLVAYVPGKEEQGKDDIFWSKEGSKFTAFNRSREVVREVSLDKSFEIENVKFVPGKNKLVLMGAREAEEDTNRFATIDLKTGRTRMGIIKDSIGPDMEVRKFAVTPDGTTAYALVKRKERRAIVRINLEKNITKMSEPVWVFGLPGVVDMTVGHDGILYFACGMDGLSAIDTNTVFDRSPQSLRQDGVFVQDLNRHLAPHYLNAIFPADNGLYLVDEKEGESPVISLVSYKDLFKKETNELYNRHRQIVTLVNKLENGFAKLVEGGMSWRRYSPHLIGKEPFEFIVNSIVDGSDKDRDVDGMGFWKNSDLKFGSTRTNHDAGTISAELARKELSEAIRHYVRDALDGNDELTEDQKLGKIEVLHELAMNAMDQFEEMGLGFGFRTDLYGGCGDSGMVLLFADTKTGFIYALDINPSS